MLHKFNCVIFFSFILLFPTTIFSQTRFYKPVSELEANFFHNSKFNVYPDDVREDIDAHTDELLVWTGIVEKHLVFEEEEYWEVDYLIKHHYYDWIEDFTGKGPIKLSPLGEGYFTARWLFKKTADIAKLLADVNGDLLIVYGIPCEIFDFDVIRLETKYIRHIPKQYVGIWFIPYERE